VMSYLEEGRRRRKCEKPRSAMALPSLLVESRQSLPWLRSSHFFLMTKIVIEMKWWAPLTKKSSTRFDEKSKVVQSGDPVSSYTWLRSRQFRDESHAERERRDVPPNTKLIPSRDRRRTNVVLRFLLVTSLL
jgi:hypothetical protein